MADRRAPARIRPVQERVLSRYVAEHVYPYSAFYRPLLDEAGLGRNAPGAEILQKLPPTSFDDVLDPGTLVLRPEERTIQRYGSPALLLRVFVAKLRRAPDHVNRTMIEPVYKPVHWHVDDGIPVAYSTQDLDRLADRGRALLAQAGIGRYDVVVGLLPAGPNLAYWELVFGARRAGLSALHLPPVPTAAQVEAAQPGVLAGRPVDLAQVLDAVRREGRALPALHTLLAIGEPLDDAMRGNLLSLAPNAGTAVVGAWAPPGVRALWAECRGGDAVHLSPETELVEVVNGELVWSGLGWKGTAFLRLRTGVHGTLEDGPCPVCGRTAPRVRVSDGEPRFVRVLDTTPGIACWQAELRRVEGRDELLVFLAIDADGHPGPLLRALDRELSVTQFVVLDADSVQARLAASGGQRVLDLRGGAGDASTLEVHGVTG